MNGGAANTARYDRIGVGYADLRRADPRIAQQVHAALGDATTIVNVGAGAGSYEPADRPVVAIDPSGVMLGQRPDDAPPAVRGCAEQLPFPDRSFGAALAVFTLHHWSDPAGGLAELCRVAQRCVVLTFLPDVHDAFWLTRDYLPASASFSQSVPSPEEVAAALGSLGPVRIEEVPVPWDCTDGFNWAYWRRPERYLDPDVRAGISVLARQDEPALAPGLDRLAQDLVSGRWAERYASLLELEAVDAGLRLVVAG